MLGPEYYIPIPRLFMEFGPYAFTEEKIKKDITTKYPEYGLVLAGMMAFTPHGTSVSRCHSSFARNFGYQALPVPFSIQDGLQVTNLHAQDHLGNPSVNLHLSVDYLIKKLANQKNKKIVNLSLQVGDLAITHKRKKIHSVIDNTYISLEKRRLTHYQNNEGEYLFYNPETYTPEEVDGVVYLMNILTGLESATDDEEIVHVSEDQYSPYLFDQQNQILHETLTLDEIDNSQSPFYEIQGAYTSEFGAQNIHELFRLVETFPDKLFVVAAGNYGDDLRPLREQFSDIWPENLIIIGHWNSSLSYPRMYGTYDVFGADIYFDATQYGHEPGNSMSTAVLSAAASILEKNGIPIEDIKKELLSMCQSVEIETSPSIPYNSTNIEDYINAYLHKRIEMVNVFNETLFAQVLAQYGQV